MRRVVSPYWLSMYLLMAVLITAILYGSASGERAGVEAVGWNLTLIIFICSFLGAMQFVLVYNITCNLIARMTGVYIIWHRFELLETDSANQMVRQYRLKREDDPALHAGSLSQRSKAAGVQFMTLLLSGIAPVVLNAVILVFEFITLTPLVRSLM